jgi:WD40 repeat protein
MPSRDVFLSHSSPDKPAVKLLGLRLKQEWGLKTWLDEWNLIPGEPWQAAIEKALADCATCAVFIGPAASGPWQNEEMRAAIDRQVRESQGGFRVIPVLLPGARRPERSRLPAFLEARTWVEFRDKLDDDEAFHRLVCGITGKEPGLRGDAETYEGQCPYRGLEAFDADHARFFFGREALTEWLTSALRAAPGTAEENRFLAIVGASGSGKSSLARAGLLPALARGALEGSAEWPVVTCRPGPHPLESLSVALAPVVGELTPKSVQELDSGLKKSERMLHLASRLALREGRANRRLVVFVDQFEEVFTLCGDEPARKALVDNLMYAATVAQGQTVVVLTMRADYYGRCAAYPALAAGLSDHQVLVGPMTPDELRRAIERPAQLVGCEFEPGLVSALVDDVGGRVGALPLLQYALLELWKQRDGRRLTHKAYDAIGQVQGAIAKTADTLFSQLGAHEQERVRDIFIRLTRLDMATSLADDRRDARRRVRLNDLSPTPEEAQETTKLLGRLTDARLLVTSNEPQSGAQQVEVAHEALIRHWPQLRAWLEQDRAQLRLREEIGDAAREWVDHGKNAAYLVHRGDRLRTARPLLEKPRFLGDNERQYLSACRLAATFGRISLAAIPVLIIAALAAGLWEARRSARAQARHLDVLTRTVYASRMKDVADVAQSDPDLGLSMLRDAKACPPALRDFTWSYFERLCQPLRRTLTEHTDDVVSVSFSGDGKTLASGSKDGTIKLWDGATGKVKTTIQGSDEGVLCARLSLDGRLLAWCDGDPTIKLWDVQQGEPLPPLAGHKAGVSSIAFSEYYKMLAAASENGAVKLWRFTDLGLHDAKPIHSFDALRGTINSIVFSTDGRLLGIAGSDNIVREADPFKGVRRTFEGHTESVSSVAFAADGTLASGSTDGAVLIWHPTDAKPRGHLNVGAGGALALAFSPSSRILAVASPDNSITLWDTVSGRTRTSFSGHTSVVLALEYSPDGATLASGGADNTIRLWDATMRPEQATLPHADKPPGVYSLAFAADGNTLVAGAGEKIALLERSAKPYGELQGWDLSTRRSLLVNREHQAAVMSLAFAPDGTLATGSWRPRIGLWRWDGGNFVERDTLDPDTGIDTGALAVVFLDRNTLAAINGKQVETWDVDQKKRRFILEGHDKPVQSLAVSSDGHMLASGSEDGSILFWDVTTAKANPKRRATLKGHTGDVRCLAFTPDGQTLASGGGGDNSIRLWDVSSSSVVERVVLTGHSREVLAMVFSPDGKTLASASADTSVRLWDPVMGAERAKLSAHTSAVRAVAFSPDGRTLASGGDDGAVKLWGPGIAREPPVFGPE